MKTNFLMLSALLLTATLVQAEPELKGTAAELSQVLTGIPQTALVTGEAEVRMAATRAVVNLAVITESKSLQEALRLNGEARGKVMAQLKQQGIATERIQAARFSSTPKFGMWGDKAKSYRVENALRVSVQDEKEFRAVASVVDATTEVSFSGVEFEYADKEVSKNKAIAQACDNAGERRKIYEERLGVKLTARRFAEGIIAEKDREPAPRPRKDAYDSFSVASSASVQESASSFGEMVFTAKVTVEYQVQPR